MDNQAQPIDTQPQPRTKAELLENIYRGREEFERFLATLTEEQLVTLPANGDWTPKDHLAHLIAWEQVLLGALAGRPDHEVAELDEATYRDLDMDGLNDVFYRRYRDLPLSEILAAFRQSYQAVLAAIEPLDDASLFEHCHSGDPDSSLRVDKIRGNTYEHYLEHEEWIKEKL